MQVILDNAHFAFCSNSTNPRDGLPDLVACDAGNNMVSLVLRRSDGSFRGSSALMYSTRGTRCAAVRVVDLNGDGRADVVVANAGSNDVSVLLGAEGGLQAAVTYPVSGVAPSDLIVADVNFDNLLDLVVTNKGSSSVSVLYG
jgi:hypothetical protein